MHLRYNHGYHVHMRLIEICSISNVIPFIE